jgi:Kef-type K+ transport system membrane component KefB
VIPVLLLLALGGLMHAATASYTTAAGPELTFGYLLLTAYFAGTLVRRLAMPKLTGYIVAGVIVGPSVLVLVDTRSTVELQMVGNTATAIIALTGGAELDLRAMRPLFGTIRALTVWAVMGAMVFMAAGLVALRPLVPFLAGLPFIHALALTGVLAVVLAAQSPAVVMALITETRADGPMIRTILAVVVLADLLVVILFGIMSSVASAVLHGHADVAATAVGIAWEVPGSVAIGLCVGGILGVYLGKVRRGAGMFAMMVCVVVAEVGSVLHLDPLVIMLTAGIYLQNVSPTGAHALTDNFDAASLPVYLVFFALAGAKVQLSVLVTLAIPIATIVIVRAVSFYVGARIATKDAEPPALRAYAWLGLLPQAGLALALAELVRRSFPELGNQAFALIVGVVGVNQLIAPILLRLALIRSGEVDRRAVHQIGD